MNYKVGDIVRIIANTSDHEYQIGDLVEITKEYPMDVYDEEMDHVTDISHYNSVNPLTEYSWYIHEDDIQLFKRKEVNETNTDNTTTGI